MTIQNSKFNDFKEKFKQRLYNFTLKLIEFLDYLPKDSVSRRIGDQLLRSGTSILGNYIEGQYEISNIFASSILTLKGKK